MQNKQFSRGDPIEVGVLTQTAKQLGLTDDPDSLVDTDIEWFPATVVAIDPHLVVAFADGSRLELNGNVLVRKPERRVKDN